MKQRDHQFGLRKNPDSPRVHGLRLIVNGLPKEQFEEHVNPQSQGPSSTFDPRMIQTFELPHPDGTNEATSVQGTESTRLLTVEEVASLLHVPVSWVYGRMRKRSLERLPVYRIGKYWRFNEADVLLWLEHQQPGKRVEMLHLRSRTAGSEEKGARIGKEFTIRARFQAGHVFFRRGKRRKVWAARWREDMIAPNGTVKRVLRFAVLGTSSEIRGKKEARNILQVRLRPINQGRQHPQSTMTLEQFVSELWKPGVIPTLRSGSSRYYDLQLRCHILPAFGSRRLCDITRLDVQCFLADKRKHGFSGSSTHGMRTTISKVLQAAVDWDLLEQNLARGIRIGDRAPKTERLYLNPKELARLLTSLSEPCHTLVLVAVLTGMRIGEILALRWKVVDLARGVIQVRETVSEGKFGSPKTKSSRRDIPISQPVCEALQAQQALCRQTGPEDLVFTTRKQTPLNPKNLLRRVLRPACKALGLPLISWHSFRHTHATQLAEVGESLRTAQSLLGHSNLETTLNVYMHAIPDAQRRAVDRVAEVLSAEFTRFQPLQKVRRSTD